ncbi:hypothetical protein LTR85_006738 [Meristemomyces frigidus]|nr:hypothetical protein LTR85_006738 [Meristemomyces frigidus]
MGFVLAASVIGWFAPQDLMGDCSGRLGVTEDIDVVGAVDEAATEVVMLAVLLLEWATMLVAESKELVSADEVDAEDVTVAGSDNVKVEAAELGILLTVPGLVATELPVPELLDDMVTPSYPGKVGNSWSSAVHQETYDGRTAHVAVHTSAQSETTVLWPHEELELVNVDVFWSGSEPLSGGGSVSSPPSSLPPPVGQPVPKQSPQTGQSPPPPPEPPLPHPERPHSLQKSTHFVPNPPAPLLPHLEVQTPGGGVPLEKLTSVG